MGGDGRAVGSGPVDVHRVGRGLVQEDHKVGAAGLLVNGGTAHADDGYAAGAVTGADGDRRVGVANHGAGGCVEVGEEGLGAFRRAVVHQRKADDLARLAWREGQHARVAVGIVNVVGAVGLVVVAVVNADLLRAGRAELHQHVGIARRLVGDGRQHADHRRRHGGAVVGRDPTDGAELGYGHARARHQVHGEGLVAFGHAVVQHRHVDRACHLTGQEAHRPARRREVGVGRGALCRRAPAQRHHVGRGPVQRDDEGRQAAFFVGIGAGDAGHGRARGTVVGGDMDAGVGRANDGVAHAADAHLPRLHGVRRTVVLDDVAHRAQHFTGREDEHAAVVVAVLARADVRARVAVAHRHRLRARRTHAKDHIDEAGGFIGHRRVDAHHGRADCGVVARRDEGAGAGLRQRGVHRRAQRERKALPAFGCGVVKDGHHDELEGLARQEANAAAHGEVIRAGGSTAVAGGVVQRHGVGRRLVQPHFEARHAGLFVHEQLRHAGRRNALRGVVRGDGDDGVGLAKHAVDWRGQAHVEGLDALGRVVVIEVDTDRAHGLAGHKDQRAAEAVVDLGVFHRFVAAAVGHAHRLRARRRQPHHDVDVTRRLIDGDVLDADHRRRDIGGVVGANARQPAAIHDDQAARAEQVDGEELVALSQRVVNQGDGDGLRGLPRCEEQRAVAGDVIAARHGVAVGGGVVDADGVGGGLVQYHHELRGACLFVDHDITNAGIGYAR